MYRVKQLDKIYQQSNQKRKVMLWLEQFLKLEVLVIKRQWLDF